MPDTKTKRQDGWATSLIGWANPFGWFGGKSANGTTLQPSGAAARGSGATEGRNPYDYMLPGYAGFNGDPMSLGGVPGMQGTRWPGSYSTYRIMLSHPTVALVRASVFSPILASSWTFECDGERAPAEAQDLLQRTFERRRQTLLMDCLRCLDFGFQAFEPVYETDSEGYIAVMRCKPLLPELTMIEVDAGGNTTGLRNGDATLGMGEYLLVHNDVEGSNYYGRSRLENIRRAWANYLAIEDQGYILDKKAAGIIPLIYFPADVRTPGTDDPNADGTDKSNFATARRLAADIKDGKGIVMENFAGMASDMTPEMAASLADKSDWKISTVDIGSVGASQSAILEKLRYYDSMLVRGYLRSERSVIEANTAGSRADSESHTASIADTDCDLVHTMIVEQINRQIVDEMLVQNFGESARGTAWIAAREIVDERRETTNKLLQAALSDPMIRGELFERVDMDSLTQWTGIKMREDARPWDEMPTAEDRQEQQIEKMEAMGGASKPNAKKIDDDEPDDK